MKLKQLRKLTCSNQILMFEPFQALSSLSITLKSLKKNMLTSLKTKSLSKLGQIWICIKHSSKVRDILLLGFQIAKLQQRYKC